MTVTLVQAVEEMRDCLAEDRISQRGVVGAHNVVCWAGALDAHIAAMGEPVAVMYQHDETGRTTCVDLQQVEWGWEKNNPGWTRVQNLITAPPASGDWGKVREAIAILDADGDEWGCAAMLTTALPEHANV